MAASKTHIYRMNMGDRGTASCDYRGLGEAGAGVDDQHRTIPQLEVDPAPQGLIDVILREGPAANRAFVAIAQSQPGWLDHVASALGLEGEGPVGLRIGIWDH